MTTKLAKRILLALTVLALAVAILPLSTLNASASEKIKINQVGLTVQQPTAGASIDLSFSSVELKHSMDYKVVGLSWYKNHLPDKLAVGSNEKDFVGGHSYTVKIDLKIKNPSLNKWDTVANGYDVDYSNINAKINGNVATVGGFDVGDYPAGEPVIRISYEFKNIPIGTIKTPSIMLKEPIAGQTPDLSGNCLIKGTYITKDFGFNWYEFENGNWVYMQPTDKFKVEKNYKVVIPVQTVEGLRFPIEGATEIDGKKYIYGYLNGKKLPFEIENDQRIFVEYVFENCKGAEINSVSINTAPTPTNGQHPQYDGVTFGSDVFSIITDDDSYIGGEEYHFVNGMQWTSPIEILSETSVFENGGYYSLNFFLKANSDFYFSDEITCESNVGYAEITPMEDPSVVYVSISFAPCGGGVLNELNVGGVEEPTAKLTPDYDFVYGEGYGGDDIVWTDVTDGKVLEKTDAFVYGHEYELSILLGTADDSYEFASLDSITVKINGKKAEVKPDGNSDQLKWLVATLKFECKKAPITDIEITVDEPCEASKPSKTLSLNSNNCKIESFKWTAVDLEDVLPSDAVFGENLVYNLLVTLYTTSDSKFREGYTTAEVNDKPANVLLCTEDKLVLVMTFVSNSLPLCSLSFNAGEGMGTMDYIMAKQGTVVTIPECEFTAPDGKVFSHWEANGYKYSNEITLTTTDFMLTAIYVDDGEHEHIYADDFNYFDEYGHYKICLFADCPDRTEGKEFVGNHNYDNDCDIFCNDCGYERTTNNAGEPLHFFEFECSEVCPNCGFTRETTHTPGEEADCTHNQTCTVCNKVLVDIKDHTPGEEADCGHDQTCTVCGAVLTEANGEHTPGDAPTCSNPQICTVCGTQLKPANGHSAGAEWITDEKQHWKVCGCGEKTDLADHTDANGDKKCDVCGTSLKKGLGVGGIIGIVLGSIAVLGGGGFCLYWFVIRKKKLG